MRSSARRCPTGTSSPPRTAGAGFRSGASPMSSPRAATASRVPLVEGLELYERVASYDDIASLPEAKAVYVDMAGDAGVREAVHRHYGEGLVHDAVVGATHWEQGAEGRSELGGAKPTFF